MSLKLIIITASALLLACGEETKSPTPDPTSHVSKRAAHAPPSEPAKLPAKKLADQAPSQALRRQLIDLSGCVYSFDCPPYASVVAAGQIAAEALLALAMSPSTPPKGRIVALKALGEMKAEGVALKLHDAAKATQAILLQSAMYEAVGQTGAGQAEVFEALKRDYLSSKRRLPILGALAHFPQRASAWSQADFGKNRHHEVLLADVLQRAAGREQLPVLVELLAKAQDPMAKHRLAAKAIRLGDKTLFPIFVKGLSSKRVYERSDAANFLAGVVAELPPKLKPKTIALLKMAQKKDRSGLTAQGYARCLKALEKK